MRWVLVAQTVCAEVMHLPTSNTRLPAAIVVIKKLGTCGHVIVVVDTYVKPRRILGASLPCSQDRPHTHDRHPTQHILLSTSTLATLPTSLLSLVSLQYVPSRHCPVQLRPLGFVPAALPQRSQ